MNLFLTPESVIHKFCPIQEEYLCLNDNTLHQQVAAGGALTCCFKMWYCCKILCVTCTHTFMCAYVKLLNFFFTFSTKVRSVSFEEKQEMKKIWTEISSRVRNWMCFKCRLTNWNNISSSFFVFFNFIATKVHMLCESRCTGVEAAICRERTPPTPTHPCVSISTDWSYASHVWINILCLGGGGVESEGRKRDEQSLAVVCLGYCQNMRKNLQFYWFSTTIRFVWELCILGMCEGKQRYECVSQRVCVHRPTRTCHTYAYSSADDLEPSVSACKPFCLLRRF